MPPNTPPPLRPHSFLAISYEGTADIHALVVGGAVTGIQAFR